METLTRPDRNSERTTQFEPGTQELRRSDTRQCDSHKETYMACGVSN